MKCLTLFFGLTLLITFSSCKKEAFVKPAPSRVIDTSLAFLENATTDSCSENDFYIKGEFNGRKLCFATTNRTDRYLADTFMNALYLYPTNDELHLIRQNSDQTIELALYCGQTHIKNRSFPYSQPNSQLEPCEFTEFQFINEKHDYSIMQNSPKDNYTFSGNTNTGMNITFTSLTSDNILEGVFEGTLKTNTGSIINVKNGKFRIKFVVSVIKLGSESYQKKADGKYLWNYNRLSN